MEWPTERLLKALKLVIDEQGFTKLRKDMMFKKLSRLAKRGELEVSNMDTEWLYRLCAASLMLHDYHWFAWEWRSKWATELATKNWVYPRWGGPDADNLQKRILVVGEQGVGDEIVFASCYNELAKDVEEAWVECDPRLIPIFERSFPENLHFVNRYLDASKRVVPRMGDYPKFHDGKPIEAFIMAGNVPKLYRHSVQDFPKHSNGFLAPDVGRNQVWGSWLRLNSVPPVGCSWSGRQGEIEPLAYGISLQYGADDHRGLTVPNLDLRQDLEGTFALISALGKVVSTTNAVAHMAGSLGVPTDCIKPPPIYATTEDTFNNRVQAWWADDYSDWYPSITMYRSQKEWRARN